MDCDKKLLWNNSRTIHAHVGPQHFQYVFWRLILNLKPRSLVFYPIQGKKTLNIIFQLWWMILIRSHSKNTYHHQSNCMYNFFCPIPKKSWDFIFGLLILTIWESLFKFLWEMSFRKILTLRIRMQNRFGFIPNHFQYHENTLSKNRGGIFIFQDYPSTIWSLTWKPPSWDYPKIIENRFVKVNSNIDYLFSGIPLRARLMSSVSWNVFYKKIFFDQISQY